MRIVAKVWMNQIQSTDYLQNQSILRAALPSKDFCLVMDGTEVYY